MRIRTWKITLAVSALLALDATAQELTLDQILAKNLEAIGGAEAVKSIESLTTTGKMIIQGGMMEMPLVLQAKRPNMMRMEMQMQGRSMVFAFDGTQGWMINPLQSPDPQKMDEGMLKRMVGNTVFGMSLGSLSSVKEAGHTVELIAKEEVEGSPAYKIKITLKSGDVITYFLDAEKFLPVKTIMRVSQMGQEMEVEGVSSNFKPVNGVLMAHTSEQRVGGRPMGQLVVEKIEANTITDDAIFKMPAPAPKPEEKKP